MAARIRIEIFKLVRRWRSYLGLIAMAAIAGLMVLAFSLGPPPVDASVPREMMSVGSLINGGFVAWMLLKIAVMFFLPLFACVVTGDLVSGESADGTLRTLLSRPVSRCSVVLGKYAVAVIYVIVLTFFLGVAAYGLGAIFLGHGALATFEEGSMLGTQGINIFGENEGIVRLIGAYAIASLGVLSVATIAFFLSCLVNNSLAAIGGAMMSLVVFQIMGMIEYFKPVHHYLYTQHLQALSYMFFKPIPIGELLKSVYVLAAYVIAFSAAGFAVFCRRDVLS